MTHTAGSPRRKLVVIGNGMAAGRVLDELFARAPDRYDVTMFGAEPRVNYDRIMLSPVLAGEKRFDDIIVHHEDWYARHHVDLRRGETVVAIDRAARTVRTHAGAVEHYDALIIAIGSRPILIPVPGAELPGVVTFRDLDDVNAMLAAAKKGGQAVVIGGGLLGLEAAAGLAAKGMKTTVVHLMPTLMERQLDPNAAYLLQKAIEKRGIEILTSANTNAMTVCAPGTQASLRSENVSSIAASATAWWRRSTTWRGRLRPCSPASRCPAMSAPLFRPSSR
jgi:nitrite reductase (NADH) large subunit